MSETMESICRRLDSVQSDLAHVRSLIDMMVGRQSGMDDRISGLESRIGTVENWLDALDKRMKVTADRVENVIERLDTIQETSTRVLLILQHLTGRLR